MSLCVVFHLKRNERRIKGRALRSENVISCSTPALQLIFYTNLMQATHTCSFLPLLPPCHVSVCPIMTHSASLYSSPPLNHDDDMCNFLNIACQLTVPHLQIVKGKIFCGAFSLSAFLLICHLLTCTAVKITVYRTENINRGLQLHFKS